jgi:drug/metabolite transporter (DMT)-like permease
MRPVFILTTLVGILLTLAGVVFILQGYGDVGPQSSFMFSNPTWVYQGVVVAVIGLLTLSVGFVLGRKKQA